MDDTDYDARYEALLEASQEKFHPETVARTLVLAGLTQLVHRLLQSHVVDAVKDAYGWAPGARAAAANAGRTKPPKGTWTDPARHAAYQREVLLDGNSDESIFGKSRDWLIGQGALTKDDAAALTALHADRTNLVHELEDFIVTLDRVPDTAGVSRAIASFRRLERYWVERAIADGKVAAGEEVSPEDVFSEASMVLNLALTAIAYKFPERERER